jgi:hypothetical protein
MTFVGADEEAPAADDGKLVDAGTALTFKTSGGAFYSIAATLTGASVALWPATQEQYKQVLATLVGSEDLQLMVSNDSGGGDYTPSEGGTAEVTVVIVVHTAEKDAAVGAIVNAANFASKLADACINDPSMEMIVDAVTTTRIAASSAMQYSNDDDQKVMLPASDIVTGLGSDGGPQIIQGGFATGCTDWSVWQPSGKCGDDDTLGEYGADFKVGSLEECQSQAIRSRAQFLSYSSDDVRATPYCKLANSCPLSGTQSGPDWVIQIMNKPLCPINKVRYQPDGTSTALSPGSASDQQSSDAQPVPVPVPVPAPAETAFVPSDAQPAPTEMSFVPPAAPTEMSFVPPAAPTEMSFVPHAAPTEMSFVPPAAPTETAAATGGAHTGVHSTWWAASSDSGGCELPEGVTYALPYALALGDESALGDLSCSRSNNLCGLVVSVQCGTNAAINAVITSVCNKGSGTCGVDLVGNAWDVATGGASPGIEDCTVTLTDGTPIAGAAPVCAQRPSAIAGNSQWYTSVGMFNTGKPVASATLNGIAGKFNGDSNYFDFQAAGGVTFGATAPLVMSFEDGTTQTLNYGECTTAGSTHIFGGSSRLRMQAASEELTTTAALAQIHTTAAPFVAAAAMLVGMVVALRRHQAVSFAMPMVTGAVQQGKIGTPVPTASEMTPL